VVWQAPQVFDHSIGMGGQGMGGPGMGQQMNQAELRTAFYDALRQGLLAGSVVALVVATTAAWLIAVRLARPIEAVRQVTRRISEGDYAQRISVPNDAELAALVVDVNGLAQRLGEVETERVRLLGEVAHEMRTPLTVLTGRVEGLQDGVFSADDELLAGLRSELRRLQRLADDLGTLSRVEEHRLTLEVATLDLAELTRRAVDRFRSAGRTAGVTVAVDAPGSLEVSGDPQRLGQVLDNLLSNALRAVAGAGTVRVVVGESAGSAVVTVADDGVGIAPEELDRIFERFYRSTDARSEDGTGVGLTVSRGIAEAHGGSLTAESEGRGHGARFLLVLPLAARRSSSSGATG